MLKSSKLNNAIGSSANFSPTSIYLVFYSNLAFALASSFLMVAFHCLHSFGQMGFPTIVVISLPMVFRIKGFQLIKLPLVHSQGLLCAFGSKF